MKKNVMWNTFGSVFYSMCQWVITILVVHLVSYEAAGSLSLAMTTSSSFSAISLFSMRNYQVSDVKGEYSSDIYVGSRFITCMLAMVCCLVASCFIGDGTSEFICINAFMLIRVAEALVDVLHGINQKYMKYDFIGKSYIFRGVATVAIFCIGVQMTHSLEITLVMIAVINLLLALLYDWRKTNLLEKIRPVLADSKIVLLLKTCFPIVIFAFLLSVENLVAKKVLQMQYGQDMLGIYSSIASPTLVVQVFASVAFNPFLPSLIKEYVDGDIEVFDNQFNKVVGLLVGMSLVVTIGAMIVGRFGLTLLFGASILEYYHLFIPIVWVTILTAWVWILYAIVVGMRMIKELLVGIILDFIICSGLVWPIVKYFGVNGTSMVQIIALSVYTLYLIWISKKQIKCMKTARLAENQ